MPIGLVLLFLMGGRASAAVAQGKPRTAAQTTVLAGLDAASASLVLAVMVGADGLGSTGCVRHGRIRGWSCAAAARARHSPARLARVRGSGQRRDDRAPRRHHDRRRACFVEQLYAWDPTPARTGRGTGVARPHLPLGIGTRERQRRRKRKCIGSSSAARQLEGHRSSDHHVSEHGYRRADARRPDGLDQRCIPDTRTRGASLADTSVSIQAFIRPMILWLWIGGLVMALGTLCRPSQDPNVGEQPIRCRHQFPRGPLLQRPPMASRNLNLLGHRHD